jgi:hypothetical protein
MIGSFCQVINMPLVQNIKTAIRENDFIVVKPPVSKQKFYVVA